MTNSSTRIPRCEVMGLCETIFAENPDLPVFGARVLGLFLCVRLTLTYLRHNLPQELLAELYGVSQATVSRVISTYTPLIAACLNGSVPTVEDLDPTAQLIVDGTLLECWSWKGHPELDLRPGTRPSAWASRSSAPTQGPWPGSATPRTGEFTTPRLYAAPACSTRQPPTFRKGHHYRSTSVARGVSGGNDHSEKKACKASPPPRRQDLERPVHRLQKTTGNLSDNHRSHTRTYSHTFHE